MNWSCDAISETRRKHPLTRITSDNQGKDLLDAIKQERILLAPLRERDYPQLDQFADAR